MILTTNVISKSTAIIFIIIVIYGTTLPIASVDAMQSQLTSISYKAEPILIPEATMLTLGDKSTMALQEIIINNQSIARIAPPTFFLDFDFRPISTNSDIVFALCSCNYSGVSFTKNPEAKILAVTITPIPPRVESSSDSFSNGFYPSNDSLSNATYTTYSYYESDVTADPIQLNAISPGRYILNGTDGGYLLDAYIQYPALSSIVAVYRTPINITSISSNEIIH